MLISRRSALVSATVLAGAALTACATDKTSSEKGTAGSTGSTGLTIVATTGYLGDAARNIAPDATVTVLVGPGGDPHTQELTTKDTQAIEQADVVLWTSHDMEHKMMGQLEKLGDKQVAAAEAIPEDMLLPWEEDGKIEGHDPHVWNSPDNWKYVVTACAEKIAQIDPDNAATYKANGEAYNAKIDQAKAEAQTKFDTIPQERRVLVTGHDAFNYLGKRYGLKVHATDFVSSEAELSASELQELVNTIVSAKVPAIFVDNLKNPQAVKSLREAVKAKGWDVRISDKELYADSLGEKAPVDTYLGVFQNNVDAITTELGAK